jgi:hypothetical protein
MMARPAGAGLQGRRSSSRGGSTRSTLSIQLIQENVSVLRARGVYERALLRAFIETAHAMTSLPDLKRLFEAADRRRLRSAGDPIPGPGPFTLYRGVAGLEPHRRVRGLSWTRAIDQARWFAAERGCREAEWTSCPDPAVYRVTVDERHVLAYSNAEEEDEFIVLLPDGMAPERVAEEERTDLTTASAGGA